MKASKGKTALILTFKTKDMRIRNAIYLTGIVGLLCISPMLHAQDFEDDIYYNPSSGNTPAKVKKKVKTTTVTNYVPTADYAPAGSYSYTTNNTRDVDEYNRRIPVSTVTVDSTVYTDDGEFSYTRRIERFHNPDVVVNTGDDQLIEYYYNQQPSQTVVNIYVDNAPWNWGWNYPYYTPSYYYNPWRWYGYNYWGPSWSLGWYDPWYTWTWAPSWNWGWGGGWYPGHHHHWYPGHNHNWGWGGGHNTAWRPSGSGASGTHRPTGGWASGSTRPDTGGNGYVRPGAGAGTVSGNVPSSRPGNMGRGRYGTGTSSTSTSAGSSSSASRPSTTNYNNTSSSSSTSRGRGSSSSSTTQRRSSSSSSSSSYNSSGSSRGSSYSGGGGSYRSSGGSGRSSGGGGGGGRGRR